MSYDSNHITKKMKLLHEKLQKLAVSQQKVDKLDLKTIEFSILQEGKYKKAHSKNLAEIKSIERDMYLLTIWNKDYDIIHQSREKKTSEAMAKILATSKDVEVTISNKYHSYVIPLEGLEIYMETSKKVENDPELIELMEKFNAYKANYNRYNALKILYLLGKIK